MVIVSMINSQLHFTEYIFWRGSVLPGNFQMCIRARSIAFTVKDPSAVNKKLLKSATINAREKAEILCEASNVALGDLLAIDYNWGELNVVSRTEYMLDEKCLAMPMGAMADMDIEPDDIDVSDTATFVWEIR